VTRTNFLTLKGQLIRKILYSNNLPNRFQRESLHFLYFLFAFGVISYLLLCVKLAEVVTPMVLFLRGMDLILIAATPTLPISIIVGIVYAV
jgi:magnesium-transporting ATPase (P-type)